MTVLEQPLNLPISKNKYKLVEDYEYSGIVVPKGFIYDGASIPRWLWSLVGLRPDGLIRAAATVHDWIYEKGGDIGAHKAFTRAESDAIFRDLMEKAGISKIRCDLAHWAVRNFGGSHWKAAEKKA